MTDPPTEVVDLLDAAPALVWSVSSCGRADYFNATWTAFTGLDSDDLAGEGFLAAVHPDDRSLVLAACRAEPVRADAEYRLRHRDGTWRRMTDRSSARPDGSGQLRVAIDVSAADLVRQEALRAEQRMELAQEAGGFGTYDWELASGRILMSPPLYRLLGIDPLVPPEGVLAAWAECVFAEDRPRVEAVMAAFLESDAPLVMDYRVRLPDGSTRWIEGRGRPVKGADGRNERVIGVNFDVSAQREREAALDEGERRLRDISENFPAIIFRRITYPDGRIEYPYVSSSDDPWLRMIADRFRQASTVDELMAMVHPDDAPGIVRRLIEAADEDGAPLELVGRIVGAGGVRWVRSLSRPRRRPDGAVVWDGVTLDITGERARESERERALATLQLAMEAGGIGIIEYDPAGCRLACSSASAQHFGFRAPDAPDRLADYLRRIHPEDAPAVERALGQIGAGTGHAAFDFRLAEPGGPVRWIAARGAEVRTGDGARRIIGALSDVTDRRRREEEREATLQRQRALLRELNHRIKNNLQMITSVLRLQALQTADAAAEEWFVRALGRVETISELHALLGADGEIGPVDFARYLGDFCARLRASEAPARGAILQCSIEDCRLDLDRAVPLGMIANELIMDALTRTREDEAPRRLRIDLRRGTPGELRLAIDPEDGPSIPSMPDGLSRQLVAGLCRQIGARLAAGARGGSVLTLPLEGQRA